MSYPSSDPCLMKIFLAIVVILLIGGSVFADYKWRLWMDARRRDRDQP